MNTAKRRNRFLSLRRWWRLGKSPDPEDDPVVKEPLAWHDYTANVATNKKQRLKLSEPIGNLTFHVHFRRLRCAKQRTHQGVEEAVDGASGTQARQSLVTTETAGLVNTAATTSIDAVPNRTRFATDPSGNIRRLDAPRARQDYFSISRSITWQTKIISRLQVHEAREKLLEGRNSISSEGTVSNQLPSGTAGDIPWDSSLEQGSILFTASAEDPFSQEYEARRRVCTSQHEDIKEQQPRSLADPQDDIDDRYQDLHVSARPRQPPALASFLNRGASEAGQGFYILADLNWEQQDPSVDPEHCILLCVKSFKDGTVELHPPVDASGSMSDPASKAGSWPYKVHDRRGGVYEYRVYCQSANATKDSVMERRDMLWSEQERAHAAQAQRTMLGRFLNFGSSCLSIRGDIVSAWGFECSSLYVEFALRYPKSLWTLKGPKWLLAKTEETGDVCGHKATAHIAGCTQICRGTWAPNAVVARHQGQQVSHFSHPFEYLLELDESRCLPQDLAPTDFPTMFFEVHNMDREARNSLQGYASISLASHCPGSASHELQAWRPALSVQQRIQDFFIGGAPELQDVGFVQYPAAGPHDEGLTAAPLVKIGTAAEVTGCLRVNTHATVHYSDLSMHPRARGRLMLGQAGMPIAAQAHRQKSDTLQKAVEHATMYIRQVTDHDPMGKELHQLAITKHTARLRQKHGIADHEELTVMPEAVAAVSRTLINRPRIVGQPQDVQAVAGLTPEATLSVRAQGEGLTYQWYKDGVEVECETATAATLALRNPEVHHTGFYNVTVSNEAGSIQSARVRMIVQLDSLQTATSRLGVVSGGEAGGVRGGRAAARRRRMLDGAVARANNPSDNLASIPPAEDIEGSPRSLAEAPREVTEVEPVSDERDAR